MKFFLLVFITMSVCFSQIVLSNEDVLLSTNTQVIPHKTSAQAVSRTYLSAAQARQFLASHENSLSQWTLEDAAGEEAITEEQANVTKRELCKLININPCEINLPSQDGSALINNDVVVVGEIKGQASKKSAVISFKNNQVVFYNQEQNNYYSEVVTK